jgi:hypothetical protein
MVTPQATQVPQPANGDPVRITAEQRRDVLVAHYTDRVARQHAVTLEARRNRDSLTSRFRSNPGSVSQYQIDEANRELATARTVEQDVRHCLQAYGDDNRDFPAVTR